VAEESAQKIRGDNLNRNEAWNYILENMKLIRDEDRRDKFRKLLEDFKSKFLHVPAAVKYHHAHEGGLVIHTAQVLRWALKIYEENKEHLPDISQESIYLVAVVHDLMKCETLQESPAGPFAFKYRKDFNYEHNIWVLAKLNEYGITLSYDEMMGIMQSHGGWSKLNNPSNRLASLIHVADMISSQLIGKAFMRKVYLSSSSSSSYSLSS